MNQKKENDATKDNRAPLGIDQQTFLATTQLGRSGNTTNSKLLILSHLSNLIPKSCQPSFKVLNIYFHIFHITPGNDVQTYLGAVIKCIVVLELCSEGRIDPIQGFILVKHFRKFLGELMEPGKEERVEV